ncbi:HAD family hydrolase [Microlunatus soli]|uniref:Putative hydrolase of the HAD superfamily n=1 Tax=Microlunatus soli TaxID=630515 RepID=A0A1H1T5A1_9ACTN|nr:HAD-IA family hydrolase [Microlunatus soli]SDS55331.1 putative hydrolase of the HAD superfamily [Microlunatus soli]
MTITWMLFDADGVLQRMPVGWKSSLLDQLTDGRSDTDPEATLAEIFAAERARAITGGDFTAVVTEVLQQRRLDVDPQAVLNSWRTLEVDPQLIARISDLRAAGINCALATNQQDVRISHMRAMPEYADVFDRQFYSAELGLAKPDPAFFAAVLEELGIAAEQALFIDDSAANVDGARMAGLRAELFSQSAGRGELDRILSLHGVQV